MRIFVSWWELSSDISDCYSWVPWAVKVSLDHWSTWIPWHHYLYQWRKFPGFIYAVPLIASMSGYINLSANQIMPPGYFEDNQKCLKPKMGVLMSEFFSRWQQWNWCKINACGWCGLFKGSYLLHILGSVSRRKCSLRRHACFLPGFARHVFILARFSIASGHVVRREHICEGRRTPETGGPSGA